MWQGILQGMMLADEERARKEGIEESRRVREEDRAIRQSEFDRNYNLAQAKMMMDLKDRYGSTKVDSDKLANLGARLSGVIRDPDIVQKIINTGNIERISDITSQAEGFYSSYLEQNPDAAEAASQQLTDYLSNTFVFSPASQEEVDFSFLQDVLSEEALSGLSATRTIPGNIVGAPPVVSPRASLAERSTARDDILAGYREVAGKDLITIQQELGNITRKLQDRTVGAEERAALELDQTLLIDRQIQVESALESASGDNPVFGDVVSLFGDDIIDQYIGQTPVGLSRRDLGPAFVNPPPRIRMTFVDENQFKRIRESGLIRLGDIVIIGGEERVVER